jgi:diguanylate cyclase (GGDEF)-like protein
MTPASVPSSEAERLAALQSYDILDTGFEDTFDDLTALAAKLTSSPIALVSLVDSDRQWFKSRVGFDQASTSRDIGFCPHAIAEPSRTFIVNDAASDPRFSDNPLVTGRAGVRFYAGVPLVNPEGHALGTLCVLDRIPREMDSAQHNALLVLARAVMTTLELRRSAMRMKDFVLTDALTGIANRAAFLSALDRALATQKIANEAFGLVYLDLDGFKQVNDLKGHAAGDHVLREVASVLVSTVRHGDLAARIGGDEFAVVLPAVGEEAPIIAERIRDGVARHMVALDFGVTASVGAVSFRLAPADREAAIRFVDHLMYQAKIEGKDKVITREFGTN